MCDLNDADDIDEFIVFELSRDSHTIDGIVEEEIQDLIQQDEEIEEVEEEVDEEEEEEEQQQIIVDHTQSIKLERLEDLSEEFLMLDEKPDSEEMEEEKSIPPSLPTGISKIPSRYLLFDELVATVVDYDNDDTPIVQFAMATEADDKLFVECGICPDVMHRSKLMKHLKTHRVQGSNRYQCIYCDETYRDYKYLAGHARRHMGIRPYVCEICKLYFSTKQDMRVHNQRRHQAKEHICEICGKTFSQNTMLKRHRESTHEKKLRFKCQICPKAYYKNFALQEHIRNVHMGQRRMLVCPFCGMQCRDAHKMARHRKALHLNQSQYSCHICNEDFTDINYFDAHKRSIQCRNNTRKRIEEEEKNQDLIDAEEILMESEQDEQHSTDQPEYEIILECDENN